MADSRPQRSTWRGKPADDGPPQQLPSAAPSTADPARLDAALATLELTVRRRLDGLLQGNHLGLVPGPGTEPGDARPYNPGDDVRRMDWSVTARTTEPHIRQTVADPDGAFESDRDARRAELWRYFDDVKDGQPGLIKVIVEYDTLIAQATSGDIVTAMVAPAVSSRGAQLWKRP
jgi:hypothetical protein